MILGARYGITLKESILLCDVCGMTDEDWKYMSGYG